MQEKHTTKKGNVLAIKQWLNAVCQNIPKVRGGETKHTIYNMALQGIAENPTNAFLAQHNSTKLAKTAPPEQHSALHAMAVVALSHASGKDEKCLSLALEAIYLILSRHHTPTVLEYVGKLTDENIDQFVKACKTKHEGKLHHPTRSPDGKLHTVAGANTTSIYRPILTVDRKTGEVSCTIEGITTKSNTRAHMPSSSVFLENATDKMASLFAVTWPPNAVFKTVDNSVPPKHNAYEVTASRIHHILTRGKPAYELAAHLLKLKTGKAEMSHFDSERAVARARLGLSTDLPLSPMALMNAPESIVYTDSFGKNQLTWKL